MREFAKYMKTLEANNSFKYLNFSFFTSHTLADELRDETIPDIHLFAWSFMLFWSFLTLSICLNISFSNSTNISCSNNSLLRQIFDSKLFNITFLKNYLSDKLCRPNSLLISGDIYLPMVLFIRFFLTIISTIGFVSLINVEINSLMITICLQLMGR